MTRGSTIVLGTLGVLAAAGAIALVALLAAEERRGPARCPAPLLAEGPRCCAPGQQREAGRCAGTPERCPAHMQLEARGCVLGEERVALRGGRLRIVPSDWEVQELAEPHAARVEPFRIDRGEVTLGRWRTCVAAGACRELATAEPGLPVTDVTPEEAERFCALAGGRLPTADEWLLAAAGSGSPRKFPWGPTGLVCRRAAFGLVDGPCGNAATGPDLAGARPDGTTPDGVLDLAGNVSEWTREPGGAYRARGGSYRSRVAAELKSWAHEPGPAAGRAPHIGFRCAYGPG